MDLVEIAALIGAPAEAHPAAVPAAEEPAPSAAVWTVPIDASSDSVSDSVSDSDSGKDGVTGVAPAVEAGGSRKRKKKVALVVAAEDGLDDEPGESGLLKTEHEVPLFARVVPDVDFLVASSDLHIRPIGTILNLQNDAAWLIESQAAKSAGKPGASKNAMAGGKGRGRRRGHIGAATSAGCPTSLPSASADPKREMDAIAIIESVALAPPSSESIHQSAEALVNSMQLDAAADVVSDVVLDATDAVPNVPVDSLSEQRAAAVETSAPIAANVSSAAPPRFAIVSMVVQAAADAPTVDESTLVCLGDADGRRVLGRVEEVFGPVHAPLYVVRVRVRLERGGSSAADASFAEDLQAARRAGGFVDAAGGKKASEGRTLLLEEEEGGSATTAATAAAGSGGLLVEYPLSSDDETGSESQAVSAVNGCTNVAAESPVATAEVSSGGGGAARAAAPLGAAIPTLIRRSDLRPGLTRVYAVSERAAFISLAALRASNPRGCDASNLWDEEPAEAEAEFSDDETEAAARRGGRSLRAGDGGSNGCTPGVGGKRVRGAGGIFYEAETSQHAPGDSAIGEQLVGASGGGGGGGRGRAQARGRGGGSSGPSGRSAAPFPQHQQQQHPQQQHPQPGPPLPGWAQHPMGHPYHMGHPMMAHSGPLGHPPFGGGAIVPPPPFFYPPPQGIPPPRFPLAAPFGVGALHAAPPPPGPCGGNAFPFPPAAAVTAMPPWMQQQHAQMHAHMQMQMMHFHHMAAAAGARPPAGGGR